MPWITINETSAPGVQRGDHGDRRNGLCWRCNLPDQLDPAEHGHLLSTLGWERDNLLHTQGDWGRNRSIKLTSMRLGL